VDGQNSNAQVGSTAPSTPGGAQGDECTKAPGHLQGPDGAQNLTEPAGIDIVRAEARVEGEQLVVRFVTAGPIESTLNPLFVVQQGDLSSELVMDDSFELRATPGGPSGTWSVRLITFADHRERPASPLSVPVTVDGNELNYAVPLAALPTIVTRVWQFGSSAGASDDTRVTDTCEPFATSTDTTGTTAKTVGTGAAAPPTIPAQMGRPAAAPDGSSVTVLAVATPANVNRTILVNPIPPDQLATIEVVVCAGGSEVDDVSDRRFTVQVADGRSFDPWPPDYATSPRFTAGQTLRPGECTAAGFVTYEVPQGDNITMVTYDVGGHHVGPYLQFTTS
jgi:hypothetical protein